MTRESKTISNRGSCQLELGKRAWFSASFARRRHLQPTFKKKKTSGREWRGRMLGEAKQGPGAFLLGLHVEGFCKPPLKRILSALHGNPETRQKMNVGPANRSAEPSCAATAKKQLCLNVLFKLSWTWAIGFCWIFSSWGASLAHFLDAGFANYMSLPTSPAKGTKHTRCFNHSKEES